MQGDSDVIEALNEVLTAELTAINQYFIHSRMCRNWGYARLASRKYEASIARMKHADQLIERVLLLSGVPNMQRLSPVKVGEDPVEQHELDRAAELAAVVRLNEFIRSSSDKRDNGTRELFERLLLDHEAALDWHEAQLHQVDEIGSERYLAEQMHD
jgi:bacterioferritin